MKCVVLGIVVMAVSAGFGADEPAGEAAVVERVLVRQQWPWSEKVAIDYVLTNVTSATQVECALWRGNTRVDLPDGAFSGDVCELDKDGAYRIMFDPSYLAEIGMTSVAEIVAYGERIYSEAMMALFGETLFSAIKNGVGGVSSSAVCFDYTEKIDGADRFLCVMVDPNESPRFHAPALDYLFDTMQVEYNRNGRATVSVSVRRVEDPGLSSIKVNLVLENEVWLLDSYTAFADFQSEES